MPPIETRTYSVLGPGVFSVDSQSRLIASLEARFLGDLRRALPTTQFLDGEDKARLLKTLEEGGKLRRVVDPLSIALQRHPLRENPRVKDCRVYPASRLFEAWEPSQPPLSAETLEKRARVLETVARVSDVEGQVLEITSEGELPGEKVSPFLQKNLGHYGLHFIGELPDGSVRERRLADSLLEAVLDVFCGENAMRLYASSDEVEPTPYNAAHAEGFTVVGKQLRGWIAFDEAKPRHPVEFEEHDKDHAARMSFLTPARDRSTACRFLDIVLDVVPGAYWEGVLLYLVNFVDLEFPYSLRESVLHFRADLSTNAINLGPDARTVYGWWDAIERRFINGR